MRKLPTIITAIIVAGFMSLYACADLNLMGETDTRVFVFICNVRDTLKVGVDTFTVQCSDSTVIAPSTTGYSYTIN